MTAEDKKSRRATEATPLVGLRLHKARSGTTEVAWEEFISLSKTGAPLIGSTVAQYIPAILMRIMLGNVGMSDQSAQILAADGLASILESMTILNLTGGINAALRTRLPQAFGARQHVQFCVYLQAGLLTMALLLPLVLLITLTSSSVFKWLGQDPELADFAGIFALFTLAATPFNMLNDLSNGALVAQRRTNPLLVASFVADAVSLPVAYWLGFHTSLGYVGIALAKILAVIVQTSIQLHALLRSEAIVDGWPGWRLGEARDLTIRLLPLMGSGTLMSVFSAIGPDAIVFLSGLLPNAAVSLATSGIAGSMISMSFFPISGLVPAGVVGVAAALGAGNVVRAKTSSRVLGAMLLSLSVVAMVVASLIVGPYARSSTSDEAVASAAIPVFFSLIVIVLDAWKAWCQANMIACAKQWLVAQLSFVFMFAVGVPLGWLFASTYGLGVPGLWYGQIVGYVGFSVVGTIWFQTFDWQNAASEAQKATHIHEDYEPDPERV